MRLLVIDEDPASRDRIVRALAQEFETAEVVEAPNALELAAALNQGPVDALIGQASGQAQAEILLAHQADTVREQAQLLDLTNDAVIVRDLHATILFWNRGAEQCYGWSRAEALGHRVHTLLHTEFSVPGQDALDILLRDGHWTGELIQTRRDGTRVVMDCRWALKRDAEGRPAAVLEINSDVTERKRAEQALRESEERYRQMFERNRAIKLLIDPDTGAIVDANPAACEFYGYRLDELRKLSISHLSLLPEDELLPELREAMLETPSNFTFRHRLASGQVRDVEVSPSPIVIQGRHLLYAIVHDITERRQAERALWHHTKRLQILHDIDQAVLVLKSPRDIAHATLHHLRQVIPARHANVMLFDAQAEQAEVLAVDTAGAAVLRPGERVSLRAGWPPAEEWRNDVYLIEDLSQAAGALPAIAALRTDGVRAHLSVPLVAQGQLIGRLNLGSARPGSFTLQHMDIARQVADSLAVAIQNARLYEREQRARLVAETLRAAHLALTQSLDLQAVYATLLDYLHGLVPYDSACVMQISEDDQAIIRAMNGYEQWLEAEQLQSLEARTFDLDGTPTLAGVVRRQESLLIPDTAHFPDWQPAAGSEHVRNWLGVPLIARGRCIGVCSIDGVQPGRFSEDHVRLAETLAMQAAVAILNARLFEEARASRLQLQTLSRRLVDMQERERRQVARELHDEASQALTSLMVNLGLLKREAACAQPVVDQLENLKRMVDDVLEDLHRLAVNLRPASLDHLGLEPALRQYVESVRRTAGLEVDFETFGLEGQRLSPESEISLYRIVQEALTNVIRHAKATRAGVLLERRGDRMIAIVEDNGAGFDAEGAMRRGRLGLVGMRERAEMLGGKLSLESRAGHGTSLFVEIPFIAA